MGKLNFLEAKITNCPLGGYKVHVKYRDVVMVYPDESVRNSFQRAEIGGVKFQFYQTGFQIMGLPEKHIPLIGSIIFKICDHESKPFQEKVREWLWDGDRQFEDFDRAVMKKVKELWKGRQ